MLSLGGIEDGWPVPPHLAVYSPDPGAEAGLQEGLVSAQLKIADSPWRCNGWPAAITPPPPVKKNTGYYYALTPLRVSSPAPHKTVITSSSIKHNKALLDHLACTTLDYSSMLSGTFPGSLDSAPRHPMVPITPEADVAEAAVRECFAEMMAVELEGHQEQVHIPHLNDRSPGRISMFSPCRSAVLEM